MLYLYSRVRVGRRGEALSFTVERGCNRTLIPLSIVIILFMDGDVAHANVGSRGNSSRVSHDHDYGVNDQY